MGFGKKILEKWNQPQVSLYQSKSDSYGFIQRKSGITFENYPFKITEMGSDAPIVRKDKERMDFDEEHEFTLTLNINEGFVYDLSLYEPDPNVPLYISKRIDGKYVFIKRQTREIFSESDLEKFKIKVEFENPIKMSVKTLAESSQIINTDGKGVLFFVITFSDITELEENQCAKIYTASILNIEQLTDRYPGIVTFADQSVGIPTEFENTVRAFAFYSSELSQYVCLNAADQTSVKILTLDPTTYSEEFKKQLILDNKNGQFIFVFQSRPPRKVLKKHLFLRMF